MMARPPTDRDAQAIDWMIRQRDPAFDDWEAFTRWLEAAPAHADAYHAAIAVDDAMGDLPRAPQGRVVLRIGRRSWMATAVAAAAVLLGVVGYGAIDRAPDMVRIATAPGEHRLLALADGSSIALNGDTRIAIDRDRPRFAQLESGEAMFRVVHRAADPFAVEVGGAVLLDVGTAFDVVRRARSTRVAVSEGAVLFNPDAEHVRIAAGRQLQADDDSPRVVLSPVAAETVGGWRTGQLFYDGAPLSVVVEDIRRGTGARITLASGLADVTFRGAVLTGRDDARTARDLAALAGLRAARRGDGWHLTRGGS